MLPLPTGRKLLAVDAIVAAWVLLWVAIGIVVGESVAALTGLTGAFRAVGDALGGVGATLGAIDVPLLGGPLDSAGEAIRGAGRDVTARGTAVRGAIERASVLLGVAVALAPTAPVLVAYGPARAARVREVAALRSFLRRGGDARGLEGFLAERARQSLPYRRLRRVVERPWDDDPATRRALAAEELRRLGLSRSQLAGTGDGDAGGEAPPESGPRTDRRPPA